MVFTNPVQQSVSPTWIAPRQKQPLVSPPTPSWVSSPSCHT